MDGSVTLSGNLTRDPELRFTSSGLAVASSAIAINRRVKKPDGTYEDATPSFVNVVAFGQLAENFAASCTKGARVIVEGDLEVRGYEREDGSKGSNTEVRCNDIAPSLKFATTVIERTSRSSSPPPSTRDAPASSAEPYEEPF